MPKLQGITLLFFMPTIELKAFFHSMMLQFSIHQINLQTLHQQMDLNSLATIFTSSTLPFKIFTLNRMRLL